MSDFISAPIVPSATGVFKKSEIISRPITLAKKEKLGAHAYCMWLNSSELLLSDGQR